MIMSVLTVKFPNYTIDSNALMDIPKVIDNFGNRVLVVGGKTALEKAGKKIKKALGESHILDSEFAWYGGECTYKNIEMIKDMVEEKDFNVIIGVGGGKALDTAKGAADMLDIPVITIPTIASTCAATTPLSIVYSDKGDFEDLFHLKNTPVHIFIDTAIIAESPWKYLWAGIGDTMAKHYEVKTTTRNKKLAHSALLAKQISFMCAGPLLEHGVKALEDSKNNLESYELREVVLNNIISTGLVSLLVGDENNGAAAHGLFYGLTLLDEIEKNHLHGEVVAYGILVMLMMDNDMEEIEKIFPFYKKMGWPTCLKDLNLSNDKDLLNPVIEKAMDAADTKKMPYEVTGDMYLRAITELEKL